MRFFDKKQMLLHNQQQYRTFAFEKINFRQMKKCIVLIAVLVGLNSFASAQTNFLLTAGEAVFVYSLPKTELSIEIEIERVTQTPGEFFRFSERFLAVRDVITTERTTFRLKSVRVVPRPVADPSRTFAVPYNRRFPMLSKISVNADGILCGMNVPCRELDVCCAKPPVQQRTAVSTAPRPLPLTEEFMLAGSVARMAEGAGRQIYRIRESRIALLTADLDNLPADGESLKLMLQGLDEMERELTELFIGTTTTEVLTHTIRLTPTEAVRNQVLFRVSDIAGLVPPQDLSGAPYYISIIPASINVQPLRNNRQPAPALMYSILPASTQITIGDGNNIFFAEQFLIPQFGITVPIPEELLRRKDAQIRIDEQTGRLLNVQM